MFLNQNITLKLKETLFKVNEQVEVITHAGQEKINEIENKIVESEKEKQNIISTVSDMQKEVEHKIADIQETVYFGSNQQNGIVRFYDMKQVVNGVATFYLTSDGTKNGTPLFKHVAAINPTSIHMTDKARDVPLCSVKYLSPDSSILEVNVVRGNYSVTILGGYMDSNKFAENGTLISVEVIGI